MNIRPGAATAASIGAGLSPLHCKGATSCFFSKHFPRRWRKSSEQKELCCAQKRRDAKSNIRFHPAFLRASVSPRESILVAAERSKAAPSRQGSSRFANYECTHAGAQSHAQGVWIPACAGMTESWRPAPPSQRQRLSARAILILLDALR